MIAIAAGRGVVTKEAQGSLGQLVVKGAVSAQSLEIIHAKLVDEDLRINTVIDIRPEQAAVARPEDDVPSTSTQRRTELYQSYPNPANPTATIEFSLKENVHVTLRIYSVTGQLVRRLVDDELRADDNHRVVWDGRDERGNTVSSGIYFYKLSAGAFTDQKKLVILK